MSPGAPVTNKVGTASGLAPAAALLVFGALVVLLRPPLPIDETRYLEVFHESLRGSPLLLRLLGKPYAEKPPLLFWLGRVLGWLGLPSDDALRLVPALSLAGTTLIVARLGQRLGLTLAGWCLASLALATVSVQYLHFDPLLACAVWGALEAAVVGSGLGFWLWSSAALLAKGPVAYLFLIGFAWALAPLAPASVNRRRLAGLLLAALVPLAAWALTAAFLGGEEFARALLWERWAGRVVKSADHAHPAWFYLPIVALGALPLVFVLLRREPAAGHGTTERVTRRLALALLTLLVVFSLISGKQPHYLEPLLPAAALLAAARLERRRELGSALRHGFVLYFALLVAVSVALAALAPRALDSFSTGGQALVASNGHLPALALVALAGLAGFALTFRPQLPVGARLARGSVCALLAFLPLHWLLGRLLFPHELARILRGSDAPVAHLGSSQHGAYAWLASPRLLPKLTSTAEVHAWWSEHPGGLLILDEDESTKLPPEAELVGREVLHRSNVLVARARPAGR